MKGYDQNIGLDVIDKLSVVLHEIEVLVDRGLGDGDECLLVRVGSSFAGEGVEDL